MSFSNNLFGPPPAAGMGQTNVVDPLTGRFGAALSGGNAAYDKYTQARRAQNSILQPGGWVSVSPHVVDANIPPAIDPNTRPEMQMSLETAHDMWRVRWGEDWVRVGDVQDAGYGINWARLAERLQKMMLMEYDRSSSYWKLAPNTKWK